jgi:hypothetical protein
VLLSSRPSQGRADTHDRQTSNSPIRAIMPSLLITVFVIQLVCHLVLTIGSKPINDLVRCRAHPPFPLRPPVCAESFSDEKSCSLVMAALHAAPAPVVQGHAGTSPPAQGSRAPEAGDERRERAGRVLEVGQVEETARQSHGGV